MVEYSKEAVKDVAQQVSNMIVNNFVEGNGGEDFLGWLEDGDAFGDMPAEDIEERMEFAKEVAWKIDTALWDFDVQLFHKEFL